MGNQKKYTPKELERAVTRYFRSITRERVLTEKVPTGRKDNKGHMIYEDQPIINDLGKEVRILEYVVPPSVGDLCIFLKIHRSTWDNYCDPDKNPEFFDTTTHARGLMHAYLERESLTREGKDLKGVLFNLENNYGYREKVDVSGIRLEDVL